MENLPEPPKVPVSQLAEMVGKEHKKVGHIDLIKYPSDSRVCHNPALKDTYALEENRFEEFILLCTIINKVSDSSASTDRKYNALTTTNLQKHDDIQKGEKAPY